MTHPRLLKFLVIVIIWAISPVPAGAVSYKISKIADSSNASVSNSSPRLNDLGQIVWLGNGPSSRPFTLYFYDGTAVNNLTGNNDAVNAASHFINNKGQVVWTGVYSNGNGFYFYNNATTTKLLDRNSSQQESSTINDNKQAVYTLFDSESYTKNIILYEINISTETHITRDDYRYANYGGTINDKGQIVWIKQDFSSNLSNIYLYSNDNIINITNNNTPIVTYGAPQINGNGQVVWFSTDNNICLYDKEFSSIPVAINDFPSGSIFKISNYGIIWYDNHDGHSNLSLYDFSSKTNTLIANNVVNNYAFDVNDLGQIVWAANDGEGLMVWANGIVTQIISGWYYNNPRINNLGEIVYENGDNIAIYLATPQVEVAKKVYGIFIGSRQAIPGKDYDLRADIAAERMASKFASLPNYAVGGSILLKGDMATGGIKKTDVQAAIDLLKPKLKAGDGLIFYVHGHGSSIWADALPGRYVAIGANIVSDDPLEHIEGLFNDILTDSALHDMLAGTPDDVMDDVQKWVLIDACKSGGFWDSIVSLKNACLITSADFFSDAVAWDLDGLGTRGLFSFALEDGLSRGSNGNLKLDSKEPYGEVSFYEIVKYITDYNVAPWNDIIVCKLDLGDPVTFTTDIWKPAGYRTADFIGGLSANPMVSVAPIQLLLLE